MKSYQAMEEEALAVRRDIVEMLYQAGSGHPGGSLSVTDILVCLYNRIRTEAAQPDMEDRDRVVLSKGHAAPALYAVLAEHGFFSKDQFKRLRKLGGMLQGHPDMNKTPGVDVCTGSLGLGVSTACGIALAGKVRKKDYHVYAILGDGELQEGIVWEAMTAAVHHKLDNLTVIVDLNGLQIDGPVETVMSLGNLRGRFESYGFKVVEADGHDFASLDEAISVRKEGVPVCILAKTLKGKGISFMENQVGWHGQKVSEADYAAAMEELRIEERKLEERRVIEPEGGRCDG